MQNLNDTSQFEHKPLRGSNETMAFTANMARALDCAPQSVELGLREYSDLPRGARLAFPRLLLAGGNPPQIDQFCSMISKGQVEPEGAIEFALWLHYLRPRGIRVRLEWIESLQERDWTDEQCGNLWAALKKHVEFPGWPDLQEQWPAGKATAVWQDFKAWWKRSKDHLTSEPGKPIRYRE